MALLSCFVSFSGGIGVEGFPLDSHDEFSQVVAWHKSAKPQAPTIEQGPRTSKTEVYIVYL